MYLPQFRKTWLEKVEDKIGFSGFMYVVSASIVGAIAAGAMLLASYQNKYVLQQADNTEFRANASAITDCGPVAQRSPKPIIVAKPSPQP